MKFVIFIRKTVCVTNGEIQITKLSCLFIGENKRYCLINTAFQHHHTRWYLFLSGSLLRNYRNRRVSERVIIVSCLLRSRPVIKVYQQPTNHEIIVKKLLYCCLIVCFLMVCACERNIFIVDNDLLVHSVLPPATNQRTHARSNIYRTRPVLFSINLFFLSVRSSFASK